MNTVITDSIPAHIEGGRIVPDAPLPWEDGTRLMIGAPSAEAVEGESCMDGTPWPKTQEEIEAWLREVESAPRVFDSDEEYESFVAVIREAREEQKKLIPEHWKKIDALFP